MSKPKIHTYEQLSLRIIELGTLKTAQELALRNNVKEAYEYYKLKNIVKRTVKDLADDNEFKENSFKAATNYILGKVFGKNNQTKGFIASILMDKLITPLIKNNKDKIISFISNLFAKHETKEESK